MSGDMKCGSNTFLKNSRAVSVCELLTLDTVVVGAAAVALGSWAGLSGAMTLALALVVLIMVNYLYYLLGMPSNVAYYSGYGKAPHVFKVCKCVAPAAAEPVKTA